MKIILIFFLIIIPFITNAQEKTLRIISIIEFEDCFLYKASDIETRDTITLYSTKKENIDTNTFQKILIDSIYKINIDSSRICTQCILNENFVVKISSNYFWKSGDDIKNYPLPTLNIVDIYIKKQ